MCNWRLRPELRAVEFSFQKNRPHSEVTPLPLEPLQVGTKTFVATLAGVIKVHEEVDRMSNRNQRSSTYGLIAEPASIAGLRREREAVCRVKRYSRSRDSITYLPLNRTLATACVNVRIHMPSTSAKLIKMCRSCNHQEGFLAGVPSTRRMLYVSASTQSLPRRRSFSSRRGFMLTRKQRRPS